MRVIGCLILGLIAVSVSGKGLISNAQPLQSVGQPLKEGPPPKGDVPSTPAMKESRSEAVDTDGLGVALPAGFDRASIVRQLAVDKNPEYTALVGVVPWPARPRHFLAIVCQAIDDTQIKTETAAGPPRQCDGRFPGLNADDKGKQYNLIFLGIYELGDNDKPVLIARNHDDYLDYDVHWSGSNIPAPELTSPDSYDRTPSNRYATPELVQRFDLAQFEIRSGEMAFGLRVGWVRLAGNTRTKVEGLVLFEQVGNDIRVIFSAPMGSGPNLWEGTRSGNSTDGESMTLRNVLIVLPAQTNGYHDLELRERSGKWSTKFTWSSTDQCYQPTQ